MGRWGVIWPAAGGGPKAAPGGMSVTWWSGRGPGRWFAGRWRVSQLFLVVLFVFVVVPCAFATFTVETHLLVMCFDCVVVTGEWGDSLHLTTDSTISGDSCSMVSGWPEAIATAGSGVGDDDSDGGPVGGRVLVVIAPPRGHRIFQGHVTGW